MPSALEALQSDQAQTIINNTLNLMREASQAHHGQDPVVNDITEQARDEAIVAFSKLQRVLQGGRASLAQGIDTDTQQIFLAYAASLTAGKPLAAKDLQALSALSHGLEVLLSPSQIPPRAHSMEDFDFLARLGRNVEFSFYPDDMRSNLATSLETKGIAATIHGLLANSDFLPMLMVFAEASHQVVGEVESRGSFWGKLIVGTMNLALSDQSSVSEISPQAKDQLSTYLTQITQGKLIEMGPEDLGRMIELLQRYLERLEIIYLHADKIPEELEFSKERVDFIKSLYPRVVSIVEDLTRMQQLARALPFQAVNTEEGQRVVLVLGPEHWREISQRPDEARLSVIMNQRGPEPYPTLQINGWPITFSPHTGTTLIAEEVVTPGPRGLQIELIRGARSFRDLRIPWPEPSHRPVESSTGAGPLSTHSVIPQDLDPERRQALLGLIEEIERFPRIPHWNLNAAQELVLISLRRQLLAYNKQYLSLPVSDPLGSNEFKVILLRVARDLYDTSPANHRPQRLAGFGYQLLAWKTRLLRSIPKEVVRRGPGRPRTRLHKAAR